MTKGQAQAKGESKNLLAILIIWHRVYQVDMQKIMYYMSDRNRGGSSHASFGE